MAYGFKDLCNEILIFKYKPNNELTTLYSDSFQPRKKLKLSKIDDNEIYALAVNQAYKYDGGTYVNIEAYTADRRSKKSWFVVGRIWVPVNPIYEVGQNSDSWFIFGEKGEIACIDKCSKCMTQFPRLPNERTNFAVAVTDNSIYALGGMMCKNNQASDLIEKYVLTVIVFEISCFYLNLIHLFRNQYFRYDVSLGGWIYCPSMINCKSEPIATVVGDNIYCAEKSGDYFEKIDLKTGHVEKIPSVTSKICQTTSLEGQFYVATAKEIYKLVSKDCDDDWSEVIINL